MSLSSLILVMPVKRFLAIMVAFLVLGLTASSAMAASNVVPKSTPDVPTTPKCPCCSGSVTMVKNVGINVLKGPTAYFKAIQAFNTKDSIKLREYLKDQKLIPLYNKAVVLIAKHNGTVTEIVKVPLAGRNNGQLVYVKNKYGEAVAIGMYNLKDMLVTLYEVHDGKIKELQRPIKIAGYTDWLKCHICESVATLICTAGAYMGCVGICGTICLITVNPFAIAECTAVCTPICQRVAAVIGFMGCAYKSEDICKKAGYCN